MNLNHLKMLLVLEQAGSISAAAEELATSQPRLTQQLQQVERELGTTLFHRSPRGLELSESGRAFLVYAKRISAMYDAGHAAVRRLGEGADKTLRLGISITASVQLLPPDLLAFHKAHPDVQVSVTRSLSKHLIRGLENERFDLCLGLELPDSPLFVREVVFRTRMVGFSSRDLAIPENLTLEEFCRQPLVLPPRTCGTRTLIDDTLRRLKVKAQVIMEIDDIATILNVVQAGVAAAILPSTVGSKMLQLSELRDFEEDAKGYFLYPRRTTPEAETFIRIAREHLRSHPEPAMAEI
ncbi:LysR family transcriptional regulator [Terriglobus albidus]|uniref:LysR family transcriptional regulator n=1 Tax=Terriglobus albidus TaxID=1592106 RepID=UPI0021DF4C99|nr:LysR family transcriptional regulator [Terriglobus albidus]